MDVQELTTGMFEFRFTFFITTPGMYERYTTAIRANSKEEAYQKFDNHIKNVDKTKRIDMVPI